MTERDTPFSMREAQKELERRDPGLKLSVEMFGSPPFLTRDSSFATLVQLIVEQHVSQEAAHTTWLRLNRTLDDNVRPKAFLMLDDEALTSIGFSEQKIRYARNLAMGVADGSFDLNAVWEMSDEDASAALMSRYGIGRWTADVYLILALRRPDVFPIGDRALQYAARAVFGISNAYVLEERSLSWAPYRSTAARILWNRGGAV